MKTLFSYLIIISIGIFFSCRSKFENKKINTHTTKDDLHREMELPVRIDRVMSLTPSITEILYKVIDTKKIVGRTQHCNHPAISFIKPVVNSYPLDLEQLVKLRPQVVFVKDDMLSLEEAAKIEKTGIKVFYLKFSKCQDIINNIVKIGKLLDADIKASLEADSMTIHLHRLKKEAALITNKPKVLILISHDPLYVYGADNFGSDMLKYTGAINAISDTLNNPFPLITREYLLKINPDVIIEGGELNSKEKGLFEKYPELKQINAYKNNKLYKIDDDLISRPGPRVIKGILELKKLIFSVEK